MTWICITIYTNLYKSISLIFERREYNYGQAQ